MPTNTLLITNINTLVAVPPGPLAGQAMRQIPSITNAALLICNGNIEWFGPENNAPTTDNHPTLSAQGGTLVPGLIDPHTHIPFAGDRATEFSRRIAGESYLAIMEAGGGIRVTTNAVRNASQNDLIQQNLPRLNRMLANGVTTVECKSGYGLNPEHELKQLRATRQLDQLQPIDLIPTYLGAHALPPEFENRRDDFIEHIANPDLLQEIVSQKLAHFCDVFCDRGAFNVEQARRVLKRAAAAGLQPKIHADELAQIGATKLAGELNAISADHLEQIDQPGIEALRNAGTIAVVLPGTSFFLGIEHCNARKLIDANLPLALATDFNPGSCMIESLPMIMDIACCQLRLPPTEVIAAVTANAAAALNLHQQKGAIAPKFQADLTIFNTPTLEEWFYNPGRNRTHAVIKNGQPVYHA